MFIKNPQENGATASADKRCTCKAELSLKEERIKHELHIFLMLKELNE